MVAAILIPVALLAGLGLSSLLQSERDARLRSVQEIARSSMLLIDKELAVAEAYAKDVAYSDAMKAGDFASLHRLLTTVRRTEHTWTTVADYAGKPKLNTLLPYGSELKYQGGPWAAQAIDAQKTRISGYFTGAATGRSMLSVDVPTPAATGTKYIISQIFDPVYFNKVFEREALGRDWIIALFDAGGVTIARNKMAPEFVGKPLAGELIRASRNQTSGIVRQKTREGVDVYGVFARSTMSNWTIAIGVPVEEIEGAAREAALYTAASLVAVLLVAAGIAAFFGRKVAQALQEATLAAHSLAGQRTTQPKRSAVQEVDLLLDELHRTSVALATESEARKELEGIREALLQSEQAARQTAEQQSRAKDNFIAMLSHELRNPLAAISGAFELMKLVPAKASQASGIVERQLARLIKMVDDLLDAQRVMGGKVLLDMSPLNVGDALRACIDGKRLADTEGHRLHVALTDGWVRGDRMRLEQVFDNLLQNAIKYTPAGGEITVRSFVRERWAVIEVGDSGAGMSASLLPTVFEPLIQGPTTIDRSRGGLGLGLAIAKGLVMQHKGSITASSPGEGLGSTFTVHLPLA